MTIKLPKLDKNDIGIYNNKTVILLGERNVNSILYKIFKYLNVPVFVYRRNKIATLECKVKNIKTISEYQLENLYKNNESVMLQNTGGNQIDLEKIIKKELARGAEISSIPAGKIIATYSYLPFFKSYRNTGNYFFQSFLWEYMCKNKYNKQIKKFIDAQYDNPIFLCMPPKTGDSTFEETFHRLNVNIKSIKTQHKPRYINRDLLTKKSEKFKVITGIREPIAQNLSMFYQIIDGSVISNNWLLGSLEFSNKMERISKIDAYEEICKSGVDDINLLWSEYTKRYIYHENNVKLNSTIAYGIQNFFDEFNSNVVDLYKYPFDKEKGYTIIKDGNIEVFVYQLEKLNNLVPELSEWVGVPFTELVRGNDASDKWIGDSYKQAQKEIEITQEYFDKCYSEPYVQHCYSQADIEKFKERWRPHIK